MKRAHIVSAFLAAFLAAVSLPAAASPPPAGQAATQQPISRVVRSRAMPVRLPGERTPQIKAAGVCSVPAPLVAVSPDPIVGSPTTRSTTGQTPFTIQNLGTGNLVVGALAGQDAGSYPCECGNLFSVVDSNACIGRVIPPGGSCVAFAQFSADNQLPEGFVADGTIEIYSNDPYNPILPVPITGTIGSAALSVATRALDFGGTPFAPVVPVLASLGVTNAGTLPLNVTGATIFGGVFSLAAGGTCPAVPFVLGVGSSCDFSIQFAPAFLGVQGATLFLDFNDGGTLFDGETVSLRGAGIATGGAFAFDPPSASFSVYRGQLSDVQSIIATNVDAVPHTVSNVIVGSPFWVNGDNCTLGGPIAPGGTCEIFVYADGALASAGNSTGEVSFTSTAGLATVPLSVDISPNLAWNPSSQSFPDTPVGGPATTRTYTLENLDADAYNIAIDVEPYSAPAYSLVGGTCLGGTIPASPDGIIPGTCTLDVEFLPSAGGFQYLYFHAQEQSTLRMTYGYGDAFAVSPGPRLSLSPSSLVFPPGARGVPTQLPVSVTNLGDAPTPAGISLAGNGAELSFDPGTCATAIPPGGSCVFNVTYLRTANTAGFAYIDFVTVQFGAQSDYLDVYGTTLDAIPATVEALPAGTSVFPATQVNTDSAPIEISVANTGNGGAPLDILGITSSSPEFVLTTDCPIAVPLSGQACCLVTVTFRPAAAGLRNGTLTVNTTAGTVTVSLTGLGLATLPPDVALAFTPPSAAVGAPSTLTVTISSLNDFPLTDVGFANSFPAGLQVAPTPAITNTCGGTVTAPAGATSLVLSGGTVPAGLGPPAARAKATTASTCSVSVAVIGTQVGALVNTLPAGGVTSAETIAAGVSTLAASGTLTVGGATPLPTAITFTPGTVAPGVSSTFDLNVGNPNLGAFASPSFAYALPAGVVVANPANAAVTGASCAGAVAATPGAGTISVTGFVIPTGGACDVQVAVSSPAPGSYPATIAADTILGTVFSAPVGNAAPAISPVTLTVTTAPAGVLSLVPPPPGPLDFGPATVGSPSAPQVVTVSNTGNAPLAFSGPFVLAGDFSQSSTTCGSSLPPPPDPLSACTATLVFTPAATGTRNGSFTVVSDAGNAVLNLTGQGTAAPVPAISLSTSALFFPGQTVGTTSLAQPVTVSNAGTAPLAISGVSASGDFAAASDCTSLSPLAPLATCGITVTFTPILPGMRTGSLAIASNDPGMPSATVVLEGDGVAAVSPNATLSPPTLAFPSTASGQVSAPLSATLSNSGSAPLAILAVEIVGTGFTMTHACGPSLAMGASCTITAIFAPPSAGSFAADVRIMTNSPAGAAFLRLTGSATAAPVGRLAAIPSTLSFGDQIVGTTSASRPFALTNVGSAVASVSRITTTGDFTVSGTCADVRPGESCAFLASFSPTAVGTRAGQVLFEVDGATAPFAVALSGNGVPVPAPRVQLSASSLAFGNGLAGVGSTLFVTVTNAGSADLVFGPLMEATGDFRVTANGCTGTLAPSQSCRIDVGFLPSIPGARSGELRFSTNAEGSPHHVALSGNGCRFEVTGRSAALVCGR